TSASMGITVAIGTNPAGATLSGTAIVTAENGVATFSNLRLDQAGAGYTLTADATDLARAISSPLDVVPLVPPKLAFRVQPSTTPAGEAITPAVQVVVQDGKGNTVTSASTSITLAIGFNPAGGTLLGVATVAAVNGVATFSNLSI